MKQLARLAMAVAAFALCLPAQNTLAVVNGASFRAKAGVAPGSLASAFGDFTGVTSGDATATPLPRQMAGVQVLVNGVAAPLLAVRPGQINFQVPAATATGRAAVRVTRDGADVAAGTAEIVGVAPGIFIADPTDLSRPGAVLNQDSALNRETRRIRRGEVLQVFATGQGPVSQPVTDGASGPVSPLAETIEPIHVYLGNEEASVLFSGLSPQFPGVWQINVRVPDKASLSGQFPLFITSKNVTSNGVTIWIEK